MDERRRLFLRGLGKGSVFFAFLLQIVAAARAFVPNVLYEPARRFRVRKPADYPQGVTFDAARHLFVLREVDSFRAISASCTHLGCTVQWKQEKREFACPCHGSHFAESGSVLSGPAPRPLSSFAIALAPDGSLEVDSAEEVAQDVRFSLPKKAV
jgi:cytochrome b6-f complex iron-sulfur subunit